jgi:prevent-host-death family protein
LAHYLRTVRQGETVVVTLRGKPVARLAPISGRDDKALSPKVEDKMWKLAAQGVLTWSGVPFQLPETVAENRGRKLLSDLVVEDRA